MSRFDRVAAHDVMRNLKRVGFAVGLIGFAGCQNGGKVLERSSKVTGDSGTETGGNSGAGGNSGLASGGNATGNGGVTGDGAATGAGGTIVGSGGTAVNTGGAAGTAPEVNLCSGPCCPTDPACYSNPTKGPYSPGAECLATQDNTGRDHIQIRQQWVRAMAPVGNTIPLVYAVLAGRSQLPWKACNQTGVLGSGGYIELVDFFLGGSDMSKHYATIGYSQFVPGPGSGVDPATFTPAVVSTGFCFGVETYAGGVATNGVDYGLTAAEVGDGAGYPAGLPHPMGVKSSPWYVRPAKLARIPTDFDLTAGTTRNDLLAKLDPSGEYGSAGFQGVFYYDDATGTAHGFAPLSWTVIYDATGSTHVDVPMREVETRSRFNNPTSPNCIGAYVPGSSDPTACQAGQDPDRPDWGGGDCTATTGSAVCPEGVWPASTTGYFLITELEQIFMPDLQTTLCVSYPGNDPATSKPYVDAQGFYDATTSSCRTAKWSPSDPANGIPMGDWCAATNAPATATCHDAWRGQSYQDFAGAKIRLNGGNAPVSCPF